MVNNPRLSMKRLIFCWKAPFFQPASVRRSARFHGLHSESSHRFERGTDPLGVLAASERATQLIEELAGGPQ